MAGETERTIGQSNIGAEENAQTPLDTARKAFKDHLEGLDVTSPEFMRTEDYIDFWDHFYTNGIHIMLVERIIPSS